MKKYFKFIPILVLVIFFIYISHLLIEEENNDLLKVAFLDVGQGDAIYIETPNNRQILIDGGPDSHLLKSISEVMPFSDRSIDLVIVTHEDNDHIGGLPVLMDNYKVDNILKTEQDHSSPNASLLREKIKDKEINEIIVKNKKRILLDEDIYLDILFPNRDISNLESNETSIVCKLSYLDKSFMFMGDADMYIENLIMWQESDENLDIDILKLGHHGSKSSSSLLWLEKLSPEVAVISAGKDNRYGHPNKEVIERLNNLGILYLGTYDSGNIIFETDGDKIKYIK